MAPPDRPGGRQIRAIAAGIGKHLFDHVRDPRVAFARPGAPFVGEADLIIVPCGSSGTIAIAETDIPDSAWQAARAGRAGVVFDASTEACDHTAERTRDLHRFLAEKGVAPERAVYLTQDREYRDAYLEHCAGAHAGGAMSVVVSDYFIWTVAAQLEGSGEALFQQRLERFRARAGRRSRRFVSLNFTPRPPKVLFLLSLMRDGLWERGHISFGGFDKHRKSEHGGVGKFRRHLHAWAGFEDLALELEPWLARLDAYGEVVFSPPPSKAVRRHSGVMVRDEDLREFDDSWFGVVTETEMTSRPSRITEKALKPLSNFHPLVTFGNVGALGLMRELGFAGFGQVIDEAYDLEPDPRRRFDLVYAEVRRLCALDEADLARLADRIADTLEANARWALVEMPGAQRRKHDAGLIDQILQGIWPAAPVGIPNRAVAG
jgi:hypothetical protein